MNETAAEHQIFFQGNKGLLKYAALSGETCYIPAELQQQTLVAEHNVNMTLDCMSLLEGRKTAQTVCWSVLFDGDNGNIICACTITISFFLFCLDFKDIKNEDGISGIGNSRLNFFTNILSSAGVSVGNSGTYRCAICKRNDTIHHCRHRNITVFILGEAPILDVSGRKPECKLLNKLNVI